MFSNGDELNYKSLYEDLDKKIKGLTAQKSEDATSITDALTKFAQRLETNFNPDRIQEAMYDLDKTSYSIAKSFGESDFRLNAIKSSLTDAYVSVAKIGGSWKDITDTQTTLMQTLGRNVIVSSDIISDFIATQKVTGVNAQTLSDNFKNIGISMGQVGDQMLGVMDKAKSLGVNAQAVSSVVVANLESLNKYNFEGGIDGLAEMAAQTVSMRVNMKDMFSFAEKVFNPEGAINMAAALQRLGVTQSSLLDPLTLLDLSQNDPAELTNQVVEMTKSFVKLNEAGNFEIAKGAKRQLREISEATSIPYETLTKMALASVELDDKLQRIKFPSDFANDDDRKLIANLAEKGKDGTYNTTFTDKDGKTVTEAVDNLNQEQLSFLAQKEKERPKTMEEFAEKQLDTLGSINASLNRVTNIIPLALAGSTISTDLLSVGKNFIKGMAEIIPTETVASTKQLRVMFDESASDLSTAINKIASGDGGLSDLGDAMGKVITKISGKGAETFLTSIDNAATSLSNLTESSNGLVKLVGQSLQKVPGYEKLIEESKNLTDNQTVESKNETITVKPKDFILQTYDEDFLVAGGTRLGENTIETNKNSTSEQIHTINLNISAPNGMNETQFNDSLFVQEITKSIEGVLTANGLLSPGGRLPSPNTNFQTTRNKKK